jgi:BirA family biotin operon repressor/biotin-[acetyl-CoA-carboxylase] ligase
MFDVEIYKNNLKTHVFGQKIVVLESVGSTNDAIRNFKEYNGFVLVANRQTHGRGRSGRVWYSDSSDNLYFSFIIREIDIDKIPLVGLFVSFSLYDILKTFGNFKIKWPNDIVIGNRKVAGILIETKIIQNKLLYAIVGVGVNVNSQSFPFELRELATSIYENYNKKVSIEELLAKFFNTFEFYLLTYFKSNTKINIIDKWYEASAYINSIIGVRVNNKVEYYIERGIDKDGSLRVENKEGEIRKLYYGDILNVTSN